MSGSDEINRRLREIARQKALERTTAIMEDEGADPVKARDDVARPSGQGPLSKERHQGQWRCYVSGRWVRSGEDLDVHLGGTWVRGRFDFRGTKTAEPTLFLTATDPDSGGETGITLQVELAEGVIARLV